MAELTNRWHLRFLLAGMMLLLMVGFAGAQQLQQSDIKAQQEQRMADDRLANQLYRDQEWDKAGAIYYRLFKAYRSKHYFGLYVDCLIQAKRFDDAESAVKEQMKINGSGSDFEVDLGYIYLLQGQEKKATRIFERVLKDLHHGQCFQVARAQRICHASV
jgi:tetratricopeptide (TPR) repeat protein